MDKYLELCRYLDEDYDNYVRDFVDPVVDAYIDEKQQRTNFGCSNCRARINNNVGSTDGLKSIALSVYSSAPNSNIKELRRKTIIAMLRHVEFIYRTCPMCGNSDDPWIDVRDIKKPVDNSETYDDENNSINFVSYAETLEPLEFMHFRYRADEFSRIARADYFEKLLPLVVKDKCIECGHDGEGLHGHHEIPFYIMCKTIINDIPDGSTQVWRIRMVIYHLNTLDRIVCMCKRCHKDIHKAYDKSCYSSSYSMIKFSMLSSWRHLIVFNRKKLYAMEVNDYLREEFETARLSGEELLYFSLKDKQSLADKLNIRKNGRVIRSIKKINMWFDKYEICFRFTEVEVYKGAPGKRVRYKHVWKLEKI